MLLRSSLPAVLLLFFTTLGGAAERGRIEFNRDVRPILSENCFYCHGQDPKHREAKLRLDLPEEAVRDRGGYAAIHPGDPDDSEMISRIESADPDEIMPPPKSHRALTAEQKATLRQWVAGGAAYQKHWAFIPPEKTELPSVKNVQWPRQPLDSFVLARLEQEGLEPSKEAAPGKWLRRAAFDLTGLPPSLDELDRFEAAAAQSGEKAYEEAAERMLASKHFGERLAIDWLDVARYADTHGFNNDSARTMWPWRDWVIRAFNDNKPYDEFITEQLAGDLIPDRTPDQKLATGFCRNHVINSEGGIIDEEYRVEYVADRVRTMSLAWLGLTMECCRCHDHKFDPLTQRDYYSFFAFFNSIAENGEDGRVANAAPILQAETDEQRSELDREAAELKRLEAALSEQRKSFQAQPAEVARMAGYTESLSSQLPSDSLLLRISCDNTESDGGWSFPKGKPQLADGVSGSGWIASGNGPCAQIEKKEVKFEKPVSFSFWIKPGDQNSSDAPLISNADYSGAPAGAGYGKGEEIRLVNGEIEFRISERFPAYALRVVTQNAGISADEWRHVTLVYEGSPVRSKVRLYVDGEEMTLRVISEGIQAGAKPAEGPFLIGADNAKDSGRYAGEIDEIRIYSGALSRQQACALFATTAAPMFVSRFETLTPKENDQWKDIVLRATEEGYRAETERVEQMREHYNSALRDLPTTMVMSELPQPRQTTVLVRGQYNLHGDPVDPGVPESLIAPWPQGAPRNRLGLAKWLTQSANPLTARVVVNRVWAQLFGVGLVKTVEDFGSQGEWPSHPELLDWLARDFVESGWNVKALYKRLVLSAAYRQSSSAGPDLIARDPENRLLARGPRMRLPAELIRDQSLEISGLLKDRVGGPSVFPYEPDNLYNGIVVGADYPGTRWTQSSGDDLYRRSIYTFWKRTIPHPVLLAFDAPDREICVARRSRTNTPLQALTLLNETGAREAARQLGARMLKEGGADDSSRTAFAFRLATGRRPSDSEQAVLVHYLKLFRVDFSADPEGAAKALKAGSLQPDDSLAAPDLAAASMVASMILNLDETLTKN